jgi:hypothetical protein
VAKTKQVAKRKLELTVDTLANSGKFLGKMIDSRAKLTQTSNSDDAAPFSGSSL